MNTDGFFIKEATRAELPYIFDFIKKLADYEKLSHELVVTEASLEQYFFGEQKVAYVLLAWQEKKAVGFALYYYNFSSFLGKPGIYLEDLFVLEEERGKGYGKALLVRLAQLAVEQDCGRLEWVVLDWNEPSIEFYKSLGAKMLDEWIINRVSGSSLEALATM